MRAWAVVVVVAFAGCVQHELVLCGDKLCPVGSFCTPQGCVLQDQIDVCRGMPDGEPCQVLDLPPGQCVEGTCQIAECGNGFMEATEVCDDGNTDAGDGCSFDCLSTETCGNGMIDLVRGEQCDSGVVGLSGDGCASTCVSEFDIWQDVSPRVLTRTAYARMVYDEARAEIVLFGGLRLSAGVTNETWIFKDGGWEQRFPASSPEARYGHSMVYSPKLGKVLLFGGVNGTTQFGALWEWDGVAWTKLNATGPSGRVDAAMSYYDGPAANDEVIMLYGGVWSGNVKDDTWSFDGSQWTQLSPATTPKTYTSVDHTFVDMFFDPRDQQLWLIGGSPTVGYMYHWDATAGWVYQALTANDSSTPAHAEVALGRLGAQPVLYGGQNGDTTANGATYRWHIDNYWERLLPINAPAGRMRAAAAWDADGLLVFGGTLDATLSTSTATTWRLAPPSVVSPGGRWSSVPTTPLPMTRAAGGAVYDGRRGDMLMVGGVNTSQHSAETWRWHNSGWKAVPLAAFTPRKQAAIAYDESREEAVVFGGYLGCSDSDAGSGNQYGCMATGGSGSGSGSSGPEFVEYDDTFVLRDLTWATPMPALKPAARSAAAMTYIPGHGSLLFGGMTADVRRGDTWLWSGSDWTNLAPSTSPPPMSGSKLAFDRGNNTVVMYGGAGALGSVWLFDLALLAWKEITPTQGPEARAYPVFVYNPRRGRMVLFGGTLPSGQVVADTWELDVASRTWERRHPVGMPPARGEAFAVYDELNARVIMYGGRGQLTTLFDDVWTYSFESNTPAIDRCDGNDSDADALVDCADPDCYPRCDPYCPPQTTCIDPRPRCGDLICAPVEAGTCADCP